MVILFKTLGDGVDGNGLGGGVPVTIFRYYHLQIKYLKFKTVYEILTYWD